MPGMAAGMVVVVDDDDDGAGPVICIADDNCVGVPRKQPMEYGYSLFNT